jgi:hypothetical protein
MTAAITLACLQQARSHVLYHVFTLADAAVSVSTVSARSWLGFTPVALTLCASRPSLYVHTFPEPSCSGRRIGLITSD